MKKQLKITPFTIFIVVVCLGFAWLLCWLIPWTTPIDLDFHVVEVDESGMISNDGRFQLQGTRSDYLFRDDILSYKACQLLDMDFAAVSSDCRMSVSTDAAGRHTFRGNILSVEEHQGNVVLQTIQIVLSSRQDCCIITFWDGNSKREFYASRDAGLDPQAIETAIYGAAMGS